MDTNRTKTIERETDLNSFANNESDNKRTQERLDTILAANAEYAHKNEIFKNEREEIESDLMSNPMSADKAFSYFGLLLGTIPPATIFSKMLFESGSFSNDEIGFILLFFVANVISAITGYFTGKTIGKLVLHLEKQSWHKMLLVMPFVGMLWGLISGGTGGIFIFIIGSIIGGIMGGMVGGVALPAFAIFHRLLKKGDNIESKHFYPIAFGITAVISAMILGF